jgi:hypothetical protein
MYRKRLSATFYGFHGSIRLKPATHSWHCRSGFYHAEFDYTDEVLAPEDLAEG